MQCVSRAVYCRDISLISMGGQHSYWWMMSAWIHKQELCKETRHRWLAIPRAQSKGCENKFDDESGCEPLIFHLQKSGQEHCKISQMLFVVQTSE